MNKLTVLLVDDHEGFINAAMRHFRKIDWRRSSAAPATAWKRSSARKRCARRWC